MAALQFAYALLYVDDVRRALSFYERAFGLRTRFVADTGDYGELDTTGVTLGFVARRLATTNLPPGDVAMAGRPAGSEIAFATPDVAAALAAAVAAGGKEVTAPRTKPWGQTIAYARDPDGHLIELCTPMG